MLCSVDCMEQKSTVMQCEHPILMKTINCDELNKQGFNKSYPIHYVEEFIDSFVPPSSSSSVLPCACSAWFLSSSSLLSIP